MIFAFGSRKASPGVTTLASVLPAVWPSVERTRLIVEADPAGGALAARWSAAHNLSWDPGLLALSTTRRAVEPAMLDSVAQPLADGLWVAAAPSSPAQITAALTRMGEAGVTALATAPEVMSFVDCGRLTADSPALPLAQAADCTILVCRPRLDEVYALMPAVTELTEADCTLRLVVVDDGPYPAHEVAESLGVELLGTVPHDRRGVAAIDARGVGGKVSRRRSEYVQAVLALAHRLRHTFDPDAVEIDSDPALAPATPRQAPGRGPATTSTGTVRVARRAAYFERPDGWEPEPEEPADADEPAIRVGANVGAQSSVADVEVDDGVEARPRPAPVEPPPPASPEAAPPPPPPIVGPRPAASRWPAPMAPSRLGTAASGASPPTELPEEPGELVEPVEPVELVEPVDLVELTSPQAAISYAPPTGVDRYDVDDIEGIDHAESLPESLAVVAAKTPDGRPVWHHGGPVSSS